MWKRLKQLQGQMKGSISRELGRSVSEETRSYLQEEITVFDVEEWTLGVAVVDLEGHLCCHGCSGPEIIPSSCQ